jgi:hypothetical protein
MKQNVFTLIFLLTFIIGCYVIYLNKVYKKNKEKFISTDIIASEMKGNEDYRQCIDQNAQLNYQSSGKYPGCHQTLRDLTNWGMGLQTDLGYGQMKYICPVSCLLKQPSDCLKAKTENQNNVIQDISRDLRDFSADTSVNKLALNNAVMNHDNHLDQLYGKKHIQDVINYIRTSGRQISDPTFQEILQERSTMGLDQKYTPEPTTDTSQNIEMAYTKPPEITLPPFGGFDQDNLYMNTTRNNTSGLLGF